MKLLERCINVVSNLNLEHTSRLQGNKFQLYGHLTRNHDQDYPLSQVFLIMIILALTVNMKQIKKCVIIMSNLKWSIPFRQQVSLI